MENKKLTQQELESHLWGAADILRGAIDAADYKHYIFGLLFYKRLSDVWEEEYEERLAEFEDEELAKDPEEHRFHIPEGCFWSDVKKKTTNIGEALNASFRAIEDSNKRLKGVFQDVDFNNKRRFPDATLELLIQHFDKYSFKKKFVPADVLGNAYEYLIAKFADDAGSKGGEFYTPKEVVRLMVECLQPKEGESLYDPTCGSAGMLLEAVHYLERISGNPKAIRLFGQERNLNTWAISQMNLFLHDIDDAYIERGDTLREPKHLDDTGRRIKRFDIVIANPPFSLKNWGHEIWKSGDPFGRDVYGCPSKSYGDLAFVQHMLASLKDKGRLGVVVPHGVLFRSGGEKQIREAVTNDEKDILESIVGLGPNMFYGTDIPACILFFNKNKKKERKGKVLFINAELDYSEGKKKNYLKEDDWRKILEHFVNYKEKNRFSRIVTTEEIKENDYNWYISKYVDTAPPLEKFDIDCILHGGVPLDEIENDYVSEVYGDIAFNKILKKEKSKYFFKEEIKDKDYFFNNLDLSEDSLRFLENLWDKYGVPFVQLCSEEERLEKDLFKTLKEMGFER